MLMPVVTSYYAIYTLEYTGQTASRFGMNWDLHATATDRDKAISHAKMLVAQSGVKEVHVKEITENSGTGAVSVRNVKTCRAGRNVLPFVMAGATALSIISIVSIIF